MAAARQDQFLESRGAIGHHDVNGGQVFLDPRGDSKLEKPPDPGQAKAHKKIVLSALDRRQERGLSGSDLSQLAAAPFSAPGSGIDLDGTGQRAFVVPLLHHMEDFVLRR